MKNFSFASFVGSLLYAQFCTKLDIVMAVGMLGRYQSNSDSDFARCVDSRKSTLGHIFLLAGWVIYILEK